MMVHCNCRCCDKCWLLCKEPGRYNDRGHLGLGQPHVPAVQAHWHSALDPSTVSSHSYTDLGRSCKVAVFLEGGVSLLAYP